MNTTTYSKEHLSALNDEQITVLFHSNNWNNINPQSRLNACQELENRLAAQDKVSARTISPEPMQGALYGYQQGSKIAINSHILNDGVIRADIHNENGIFLGTHEDPVSAVGWNIYDTIVHEHTHGVREDLGLCDNTYFSCRSDRDLYRIQQEEAVAFATGQLKTLDALSLAESTMGRDPEREEYINSVKLDSYELALESAKEHFNDPSIDKILARFIDDRENYFYRENQSPSYQKIYGVYQNQMVQTLQEQFGISQEQAAFIVKQQENEYIDNAQHVFEKDTAFSKVEETRYDFIEKGPSEFDDGVDLEKEGLQYQDKASLSQDFENESERSNNIKTSIDDGVLSLDNNEASEDACIDDGVELNSFSAIEDLANDGAALEQESTTLANDTDDGACESGQTGEQDGGQGDEGGMGNDE